LDRLWKPQVFLKTTQVKYTAGKIVLKVIRLWLHTTIYSGKDKYKNRYTVKKRPSEHKKKTRMSNSLRTSYGQEE